MGAPISRSSSQTDGCGMPNPVRTTLRLCAGVAELHDGDLRSTANQTRLSLACRRSLGRRLRKLRQAARCWRRGRVSAATPWHVSLCRLAGSPWRRRTLSARPARCAGCAARGLWLFDRRHRHSHDRLSERLRAAVSRGDRSRRKRSGPLQLDLGAAFDGSRLSKLYAEDIDHPAIIARLDPRLPPMPASARPASISANSSFAQVSWRQRRTAAIFTQMSARGAAHESIPVMPASQSSLRRLRKLVCAREHPGLCPRTKTWMAGTSPAMTISDCMLKLI